MRISYYLDDDSALRAIRSQATARGFRVVCPDDVGLRGGSDDAHLRFAAENGLVLVSGNEADFIRLHWDWMAAGREHAGVIIAAQALGLGERVRRLLSFLELASAEDMRNKLEFLSDWG